MSRRHHHRNQQPNSVRTPVPNGSALRPINTSSMGPGFNASGMNTMSADWYNRKNSVGNTVFPPGDPIIPVPGLDDAQGGPRQYGYQVGINVNPQPRSSEFTSFETLRTLAATYYGIQLCERVIFRVVQRLELRVSPMDQYIPEGESATDEKWVTPGLHMQEWFQEPDHRGTQLTDWMVAATRDMTQIDALGIFHRKNRGGGLFGLELVAGDTIQALTDAGGRIPLPPAPAYRQTVYGVPALTFTMDDMDYIRDVWRTDSMYGFAPVESILLNVNQALRKQDYDLRRYTDGATPAGVLETQNPQLLNLTPDQVQVWEMMWNAILAGNSQMRMRTKAVPPGWTFKSLQEAAVSTDFDRWLLNITVAAYGLTMDELGFTDTSNRAVGASQEHVIYRNAVQPRANIMRRIFNKIICKYDGMPLAANNATVSRAASPTKPKQGVWDARYTVEWKGIDEPEDFNAKIESATKLVNGGIFSRTEAKRWLGLPITPNETEVPAFITAQGGMDAVIVLDDIDKNRDLEQQKRQIGLQQAQAGMRIQQDQAKAMDQQIMGPEEQAAHPPPPEENPEQEPEEEPTEGTPLQGKGKTKRLTMPHEHRFVNNRCMVCGCGDPGDDHGKPLQVIDTSNTVYENHTGIMVAFMLPSHLGQLLAVPGGCPVSELHCTVSFHGNIGDGNVDKDTLINAVKQFAAYTQPVAIDVTALERFGGNPEDGSPIVARVTSQPVIIAHDALMQVFDEKGIYRDTAFPDYKPHITLLYVQQDMPSPAIPLPNVHGMLSYIWVCWGNERYAFELQGSSPVQDERMQKVELLRELKADLLRDAARELGI